MAAAHGGQVLVSETTNGLVEGMHTVDLGEHRLKDLLRPIRLYQLQIEGHAGDFPPLRSLNRTNLPLAAWPLVGRERELVEIRQLVLDRAGIVTLTGPGGSGKTRLALQAAADLSDAFPDGVFFVALAPLRRVEALRPAIAEAMSLRSDDDLGAHLAGKKLLLVLDNAEHLRDVDAVVGELLTADLVVLVTSRSRLHLAAEREVPVDPLSDEAAVELFLDRAAAAGRRLIDDDAAAVTAICRRVDNLPLAVELAAARTKLLAPAALLRRLDAVLPLLAGGPRDVPDRQRTLRATIEWSHDLLDEREREAFRRLSAFRGTCSLSAAEAVAGVDLELAAALVDQSLLKPVGDDRFLMLETVREYARERLAEAGEAESFTLRHARHYLQRLEEIDPVLRGPRTSEFLSWFGDETDNLRAMLDRLIDAAPHEAARAGVLLTSYWTARGQLAEGRGRLETLLALELPVALRGRLLHRLADVESRLSNLEAAESATRAAIALAETAGDHSVLADALIELAWIEHVRGRSDEAVELGRRALAAAVATGDERREVRAQQMLGVFLSRAERYAEGRDALKRGGEGFRRLGDRTNEAISKSNLANIEFQEGDYESALATYSAAAGILAATGHAAHGNALIGLGYCLLALDRRSEAAATWLKSMEITAESKELRDLATAVGGIGLAAGLRDPVAAARLRGAAAELRSAHGDMMSPADEAFEQRHDELIVAALGEAAFASEQRAGAALTLDETIELARSLAALTTE
jgi:predicted ATPase